jgi:hypothetical protein
VNKGKCAQKCLTKARKTSGPYTGCKPPDYTDPETHACIFDPVKGVEAKASAKMAQGVRGRLSQLLRRYFLL